MHSAAFVAIVKKMFSILEIMQTYTIEKRKAKILDGFTCSKKLR